MTAYLHHIHLPSTNPTQPPLMFLHGLFGYGRNWRSIARAFENHTVVLPDLRNHGQSFHDDDMSLSAMAADIEELRQHLGWETFGLIGHSLGGKVAMQYAHDFGQHLTQLFVLDIAPKEYPLDEHSQLIAAMQSLDLNTLQQRKDADLALQAAIPETAVRQFLLSNLKQTETQWHWQMNLAGFAQELKTLKAAPYGQTFRQCPVYFLGGAKANYITAEDLPLIHAQFPEAQVDWLKSGHWLHVEQPEALVTYLKQQSMSK